jgi:subtilisin family serine protease
MSGVSWGAQIVPVRVLGPDGSGTECTIAAGIVYAASETYIANMSFGAPGPCSVAMQEAVDFAVQSPTLLIAAAGNDARSHNPSMEPANCQGVVGVGATDERDHVAAFSEHGSQVMFTAPGVRVLAAYRTPQGGHTYGYLSGTSLAAPMVSGVAALLYSRYATWGTADVIARLRATAFDLGKKGRDPYYGYGRIDAGRALTAH